ncbi:MAG: tetratricopeptide repeat protein [Chloroflexi bacterium]|nr:MAG: tetratricopeptide repeat protein [Chloroflexota bacterium]
MLLFVLAGCVSYNEQTNAGNALYYGERYEEAVLVYQAAQINDPDRPEAYMNLGLALLSEGDYNGAEAALKQALQTTDSELAAEAYYNLGNVYFEMAAYEDAIGAYQQTLLINPDDEDARYNLELAWSFAALATPTAIEQQTQPEQQQANTMTPTPNPGDDLPPTPTPPPQAPEDTTTPEVPGIAPEGTIIPNTPMPRVGGPMTVEDAMELLDAIQQDLHTLREFQEITVTPDAEGGKGW